MTASEKALVPKEVKAHRYLELDSLRGLAAFSVLLYHFSCIWFGTPAFRALRISPAHILVAGHEAVVFFFLLSGFVLCVPFSSSRPPSYPAYLTQRLIRIYLPYAAAIVVALALDNCFYSSARTGNFWLDQTWTQKPTRSMLKSLLLTMSLYGTQVNTAIWSVLLEIRISLIFPLLYFAVRNVRPIVIAAFFLFTPLLVAWSGVSSPHFYSPFFTAGLFCCGILLYIHLEKIKDAYECLSRKQRISCFALFVVLFEVPLMIVDYLDRQSSPIANGLLDYVVAAGAAGIIVASVSSASLRKFLHNDFLLRNGALSYSTYLIHGTILFALIRYFTARINLLYILPVFLVATYLASEAFHFLVDSRAVLLGRSASRLVRELRSQ